VTAVAERLTITEASLLAECETVIERGMGVFIETGTALTAVRDRRLYRETHGTFEDYCRDRWSLSTTHANRLIESAKVIETISTPIGVEISASAPPIPATESQARELAPLLDDPEELREVWQRTVERTEGKPTAAAIRETRREREDPAPEPRARPEPPRPPVDDPTTIEADRRRRFTRDLQDAITSVWADLHPDPVTAITRSWERDAVVNRGLQQAADRLTPAGIRQAAELLHDLADHLEKEGVVL
jgi:hypothetical protein